MQKFKFIISGKTLEEATVGTHIADEESAGSKADDGDPGIGLTLGHIFVLAQQEHRHHTDKAQG